MVPSTTPRASALVRATETSTLHDLLALRELLEHQLRNKAMAPFCAASKPPVEEEVPEDGPYTCYNCGQFRQSAFVKGEWYCKTNCEVRARRGVLSRKRAQDIPPRRGS